MTELGRFALARLLFAAIRHSIYRLYHSLAIKIFLLSCQIRINSETYQRPILSNLAQLKYCKPNAVSKSF